ncbi:probable G-protein coupled receptor 82 [Dromiciops gliroides]|uniref:probable G-protein coupled receptor 82 n=1 Tax=Dromiciops gliroides TaxID=33562 RepID=UPI001CC7FEAB|nr:probable G-protein coupled receptor 82 [Dromiciops gliroides]
MCYNSTCIEPSEASSLVLPIIYNLLCILGLLGNILSQGIFLRKIARKSSTHIYLINLVTANLLVCCAMPFMSAYFSAGYDWEYWSVKCQVVNFLGTLFLHVSMFVSLTILSWIAISRYATLMKNDLTQEENASFYEKIFYGHILKKFCQPNFAKKLCFFIWGAVLAIIIPVTVYYSAAELYPKDDKRCYSQKTECGGVISRIARFVGTAYIGFCFLVVLLSYYSFASYLRKIRKGTSITKKYSIYCSVKRHLLVIQFLLIVCFLPYSIFIPIFYALSKTNDSQQLNYLVEIKNFLLCLAAARSSTDPIIFLLLDKTFKRTLCNLFRKDNSQHETRSLHQIHHGNSEPQ